MLYQVLIVAYLVVALMLIGFVLIQQGKGADMGASFGAGGANTVFGSSGSGNFMTRTTAILATVFFVISLVLGAITARNHEPVDPLDGLEVPVLNEAFTEVPNTDVPASTSDVPVNEVNEEASSDVPN